MAAGCTRPRSQKGRAALNVTDAAGPVSFKDKLLWSLVVLVVYAVVGTWGQLDFTNQFGYFDLLADALLEGHLYIAQTPEQGFLQDMIPFEGRYYLQWGPFPALLHLGVRLFGLRLSDRVAALLAGWLAGLVFLEITMVLRRRHFAELPKWVCQWFYFAFALATPAAMVSLYGSIYHESITIAAACVLLGFWAFLHYLERTSAPWAALSGIAIALALTTRATQGLYAAGIFAGVAAAGRTLQRPWKQTAAHLAAFSAPVALAVALMMAYNNARFHSPWEPGLRFLPAGIPEPGLFALRRVPENFRHYVLAPIRLTSNLPWIQHIGWPPNVYTVRSEDMSSMFLASPFLLLSALLWGQFRGREQRGPARIFALTAIGSVLLVFFALLCYFSTSRRYLHDFVPVLMIAAFLGVGFRWSRSVSWLRWKRPAWALVILSFGLHAHLSLFPEDGNAMKTFVAVAPLIRRIAPHPYLDEREATTRGLLALRERRYAEAARHFERAAELNPSSRWIERNLQWAREQAASR